ncbi:unnamed protein product [Spirodela intermedia]|uniref:Uncharacterized protein n=1 Tax=Spirodela intermedia TaxID=51605 RepID=A0A7I8IMB1_SPIIN|nr:unnamed protein product [Spirodela intermedia]CAA6658670.1 unnamed protein product [Spirodela intermedia]
MGTLVGHVAPGFGFLIIGLWQLFNHIKLYCQRPKSYPLPHHDGRLDLHTNGALYRPSRHQPLDPTDWTIPSNHLHNFEHATISFTIFTYAAFALHFDRVRLRAGGTLSFLLGALAFAVELLLFYLHSTDHAGVEWQYHWLLQVVISVSLITTVMGIGFPTSFTVGFVRSLSTVFQGVWFNVLGIMLYTPRFIPKGCSLQSDDGRLVVPCDDHLALHRAKALVNLQFAWSLIAVVAFSMWFYFYLAKKYPELAEYECLAEKVDQEDGIWKSPKIEEENHDSFADVGKWLKLKDLER